MPGARAASDGEVALRLDDIDDEGSIPVASALLDGGPERVRAFLGSVETVGLTRRVLDEAGRLVPPELRSLGAIHLAVALSFGDVLASIVTYDDRLRWAAAGPGVTVEAPGHREVHPG